MAQYFAGKQIGLIGQTRHQRTGRLREHLRRRRRLQRAAVLQYGHAVGEQAGLLKVVRHQNDRDGQRTTQLDELAQQLAPRHLINRRERLIEQQHLRLARQCAGNRHALLLSAGQLGRAACVETIKIDARQPFACLCLTCADWQMTECHHDIGQGTQMRKQGVMLEDKANTALLRRNIDGARRIEPGFSAAAHVAAGRSMQAGKTAQDGRLATPRGAHQREQFTASAADVGRQRDRRQLFEAGFQPHRRTPARPSR